MVLKLNPASGVPIYLQLMEQIKYAIETGAVRAGEQLPGIRRLAEDLVMNPNTVAKAYRELEHEGVIELRHGSGAFVSENGGNGRGRADRFDKAKPVLEAAMRTIASLGLTEEEMRRLFENELNELRERRGRAAGNGRTSH
ncbi:MAG TPA: GntR family transcriptional regulator [Bryobacteraceae bacterium]|nr:GntR family transcriptional regulator [Bryobacteraceae bacterium]